MSGFEVCVYAYLYTQMYMIYIHVHIHICAHLKNTDIWYTANVRFRNMCVCIYICIQIYNLYTHTYIYMCTFKKHRYLVYRKCQASKWAELIPKVCVLTRTQTHTRRHTHMHVHRYECVVSQMWNTCVYGVALVSWIDKIIRLFCKRAL